MRCLAWLHTAPQPKDGASIAGKAGRAKSQTRMQGYIDKGTEPPLPPAGCAEYLIGYLFDAGPVGHGAAGVVPLQWQELTHWQRNVGIELRPWEAITLRRLSVDYITASLDAESPTCPAPWLNDDYADADVRKATAKQIRSVLRR